MPVRILTALVAFIPMIKHHNENQLGKERLISGCSSTYQFITDRNKRLNKAGTWRQELFLGLQKSITDFFFMTYPACFLLPSKSVTALGRLKTSVLTEPQIQYHPCWHGLVTVTDKYIPNTHEKAGNRVITCLLLSHAAEIAFLFQCKNNVNLHLAAATIYLECCQTLADFCQYGLT